MIKKPKNEKRHSRDKRENQFVHRHGISLGKYISNVLVVNYRLVKPEKCPRIHHTLPKGFKALMHCLIFPLLLPLDKTSNILNNFGGFAASFG